MHPARMPHRREGAQSLFPGWAQAFAEGGGIAWVGAEQGLLLDSAFYAWESGRILGKRRGISGLAVARCAHDSMGGRDWRSVCVSGSSGAALPGDLRGPGLFPGRAGARDPGVFASGGIGRGGGSAGIQFH